jgi:hypothetical protein
VGRLLGQHAPRRVQRAPADFGPNAGLAVWRHSAGWALARGSKSPWKTLRETLAAYAALRPEQQAKRVEALMEVAKAVQRWRDHHGITERGREEFSQDELNKLNALDELRGAIRAEWVALGTVAGTLEESEDDAVLPEPALTKQVSSGETKIGFFNRDTEIVDKDGNVVAQGTADVLCRASRKGAPEGGQPVNYWWVEAAEPQLQGVEIFGNQSKNQAAFTAGYALASDVSIGSRVEARNDLRYSDRSDAALFPLFPAPPSVRDVRQLGLGDCYLQAALVSIVHRDPDFIRSIMRDDGDTVTVRLFDITPGPPKVLTPRRVTVAKTVPAYAALDRGRGKQKGDEAFSGGALWAQMLEKAYVAAGFQGFSPATMPVPGGASYGRIESGNANFAYEHLTGAPATTELIAATAYEHFSPHGTWLGNAEFQRAVIGPLQAEIQHLAETEQNPGDNDAEIMPRVRKNQEWNRVERTLEPALRELHESREQVRLRDVEALLRRLIPDTLADQRTLAIQWVTAQRIYPGKRGTGIYTEAQDALYDQIRDALAAGRLVTVGSKEKVARVRGGRGRSAGEDQNKGLAGPHGYAVLEVQTSDTLAVNIRPAPNPPLKFVKLRNPWGSYGRTYTIGRSGGALKVTAGADEQAGEFWLLLEDLTKRFDQVSIGDIPQAEEDDEDGVENGVQHDVNALLAMDSGVPRRHDTRGTDDAVFTDEEWQ